MRNVRELILLAFMTLTAVTAVGATSAQALTIEDEGTGQPCPALLDPPFNARDADGGCLIHATTDFLAPAELRRHVFGIEVHITECNVELHMRLSSAGEGYIYEQHLTGPECNRAACGEFDGERQGHPWGHYNARPDNPATHSPSPAVAAEVSGLAEGTEALLFKLCVETSIHKDEEDCEIAMPFQSYDNGTFHRQEFGHATEIAGTDDGTFRCELVGHWNTELGGTQEGDLEQDVEVSHL